METRPFKIRVPDTVLEDLKRRLERTRWPDEIPGSGWEYGSHLSYVKELVQYWCTSFDWRAQEETLNRWSQFRTTVDGMAVHFIHARGKGPSPMPLIVTHGWPSSFWEMQKILPLLTDPGSHGGDPADCFDVVVPSLPGYGFSGQPQQPGMQAVQVADIWAKLMSEVLSYPRFAAQGGDWGAAVTSRLGFAHPEQIIGIHITLLTGNPAYRAPGARPLSPAEEAFLAEWRRWMRDDGGYFHIQGRMVAPDRAKAISLLDEALAISTELGMRPLMERVAALQQGVESQPARAPTYPGGLTQREVDVLRLIATGKADREIAQTLVIAESTVRRHISNLYLKIGVTNRAEATRDALRESVLSLDETPAS